MYNVYWYVYWWYNSSVICIIQFAFILEFAWSGIIVICFKIIEITFWMYFTPLYEHVIHLSQYFSMDVYKSYWFNVNWLFLLSWCCSKRTHTWLEILTAFIGKLYCGHRTYCRFCIMIIPCEILHYHWFCYNIQGFIKCQNIKTWLKDVRCCDSK